MNQRSFQQCVWRTVSLAVGFLLLSAPAAWALISGGEGNDPIHDPGWPKGAAAVFNAKSRIAYWEGPPFGGGQWHAECRADAATLNEVLVDFANIETDKKRIVLHDGVGRSFWLNPNREPAKEVAAMISWAFTVWQPDKLEFQQKLPAEARGVNPKEPLLAQLDIYTGGNLDFAAVKLPKDIPVEDRRLEAHGFKIEDGVVLEGVVKDLASGKPLTATAILERIETPPSGGYAYVAVKKVVADAEGHWMLKQAPPGRHRLLIQADGYVSRLLTHEFFDEQPRWSRHDSGLVKAVTVSGKVVDESSQPLPDVQVRLADVQTSGDERYSLLDDAGLKTDAEGRFRFETVPAGKASIWLHKPGYYREGLRQSMTTPATDIELRLLPAATLRVKVDFSKSQRPEHFIVHVKAEGGERVGKWGGSGNIDVEGRITFENVHPGTYAVTGMPNPGSKADETEPVTIELKGREIRELQLQAKPAK